MTDSQNTTATGDPLGVALDAWRATLNDDGNGGDTGTVTAKDVQDARDILEASKLDHAARERALAMVADVFPSDPDGWAGSAMWTDDAVDIMVAALSAELVTGDPGDGRRLWSRFVGGPYKYEENALYWALRHHGDDSAAFLASFGLDAWDDHHERVPSREGLQEAAEALISPRCAVVHVDRLGWLLFAKV